MRRQWVLHSECCWHWSERSGYCCDTSCCGAYGQHHVFVAVTVSLSLVGVVLWGTLAGSTLPFVLRLVKLDPASASAPLVATLVDVTGLVIYFSIAGSVLRGTLL